MQLFALIQQHHQQVYSKSTTLRQSNSPSLEQAPLQTSWRHPTTGITSFAMQTQRVRVANECR